MRTPAFIEFDRPKRLFPLAATSVLLRVGEQDIRSYVYDRILDPSDKTAAFAPSPRAFANKDQHHLRTVYLLDPLAEFYFCDFVIKNSPLFQSARPSTRRMYGYAFKKRKPLNPFVQYHAFRRQKYTLKQKYSRFLLVDISNCFSSFYHHDVTSYIRTVAGESEAGQFGQFLREIAAGRSIDCFPQGLYPAKTIGNHYLAFAEESRELRSTAIIRFLDDFCFFSAKRSVLERDMETLQHILAARSLYLNEKKTRFGARGSRFEERKLDPIKRRLLEKREERRTTNYDDSWDSDDEEEDTALSAGESSYLMELVQTKDVAEEDVELALSLLGNDTQAFLELTETVFAGHPHLLKMVHYRLPGVEDEGEMWNQICAAAKSEQANEFGLFWLVRMILDHYEFDQRSADVLIDLYQHPSATEVVRAAILETERNDHGLLEIKESALRNSGGGLIGVSALVGVLGSDKAKRNQAYKYAARVSDQMALYCRILSRA